MQIALATHRLSVFVIVSNVGEIFTTLPINGIGEARVVGVQLGTVRQDLISEAIELADTAWKPWNDFRVITDTIFIVISARDDLEVAALLLHQLERIRKLLVGTCIAFNHELVACQVD